MGVCLAGLIFIRGHDESIVGFGFIAILMFCQDYARVTCAETTTHRPSRRAHTSV
jgi:hypothetical protein